MLLRAATLRLATTLLPAATRLRTAHRRRVVTLLPVLPGAVALMVAVAAVHTAEVAAGVDPTVVAVVAAHTVAAIAEWTCCIPVTLC